MILIPLLDKVTLGWSKQEDDFFMAAIKPICFNLTCHTADTRLDCLVGIDHTETKRGLSTTNYLSGPCTQGLNLVIRPITCFCYVLMISWESQKISWKCQIFLLSDEIFWIISNDIMRNSDVFIGFSDYHDIIRT